MAVSEASSWYVAETQPRKEALAALHLDRQRFEYFLPRFRKTRRHARKFDTVLAPLFPGYIFVRFDKERSNWRSINGTFGVRRLICGESGALRSMPARIVEHLQSCCDGDIYGTPAERFKPGQTVRITTGPFADLTGQILTLDDKGRVALLLDILGGGVYHSDTLVLESV